MAWDSILFDVDPLSLSGDLQVVQAGKSIEAINYKFETHTELTIATGAITRTQVHHSVGGEGAAADQLDTIGGGVDGMLLLLRRAEGVGYDVTVAHNQSPAGTDNILLANGDNFVMDEDQKCILLIYDASLDTNGAWVEIARGSGSPAVLTSSTPQAVDGTAAAVGVAGDAARADHVHALGPLTAALDFSQQEGQNFVIEQLAAAPGAPVQGQVYYDTVDDNVYVWRV